MLRVLLNTKCKHLAKDSHLLSTSLTKCREIRKKKDNKNITKNINQLLKERENNKHSILPIMVNGRASKHKIIANVFRWYDTKELMELYRKTLLYFLFTKWKGFFYLTWTECCVWYPLSSVKILKLIIIICWTFMANSELFFHKDIQIIFWFKHIVIKYPLII